MGGADPGSGNAPTRLQPRRGRRGSPYAIGPLLVGVILTVNSGATALVVTAALNVAGSTALATSTLSSVHAPANVSPSRSSLLGPLRRRGFALLALAMLGIGIGGGPLEVAILARTQQEGHPNLAGYLIAALSVGSACGGLLWGHLRHQRRVYTQLGTWWRS